MSNTISTQVLTYHLQGDVACITIDNPPVNALSQAVRAGLQSAIAAAQADSAVKALVLLCKGKTFCADADTEEFSLSPQEPELADVIRCLEQAQKPVIAAIQGTASGGGLEVALGCHYRIATADARFALPQVTLGLLPCAGATQRLPRLIGAAEALEMIVHGKPISAQHALRIGLLDELAQADLASAALALARRVQHEDLAPRRVSALAAPEADSELFTAAEQSVRQRRRGYEAPLSCVKAVRAAVEQPFDKGLQIERALFDELKASPQSRALRHAFSAERQLHEVSFGAKVRSISQAAVIGAGTMGGGIAMCFANAGIRVVLLEKDAERLGQGLARIKESYANSARRGRLSAGDVAQRLACIQGSTRFEDLADVDLVIEAVFEEIGLKHEIFKTLDRVCKPGAILASNTSYLDIDNIASATQRPQDVVGMHFFSPANVMQLLENVRGSATSDEVCATVMEVGRRLGKVAVLVRSCDGFVGNRMLSKRTRESYFLLQEGASPYQIDRVLRDFGLPMGPFAMADLAGLDVGWRNRQSRLQTLTPRERECDMLDRMYAAGRLGQKTQGGFYDYDSDRKATPSPAAEALVAEHRAASGRQARQISDQEILERCLYSMINEAAYILEEKIVERVSDIDVVWLKGYGFPAYRGGPLWYADEVGLPAILAGLRKYETEHGAQYWKPANLIVKLAQEGRGFHDGTIEP